MRMMTMMMIIPIFLFHQIFYHQDVPTINAGLEASTEKRKNTKKNQRRPNAEC
jgi:hypothetical protein